MSEKSIAPVPAICCPRCHGELDSASGDVAPDWSCGACGHRYPVVAGIPDLRVFPDPYIGLEEDRAKASALAERLDDFDFAGLVAHYYESTPAVPPHHARLYARGLMAAEARAEAFLDLLEGPLDLKGAVESRGLGGSFLDLGCGTAPLAVVAARRGHRVLGVDIALRWLVVARKRLSERGVDAPLVCACAEALPLASGSFDRVGAESLVDQVRDQQAAVGECHRVLVAGGRLLVSTPNRSSLGPDPQTGIWAGSWLPERAVARIVRRQGGIPPRRKLLSGAGLRRLLAGAGFARSRLQLPRIAGEQRRLLSPPLRAAAAAYGAARALPGVRRLLRTIAPLLVTAASKPEHAAGAE